MLGAEKIMPIAIKQLSSKSAPKYLVLAERLRGCAAKSGRAACSEYSRKTSCASNLKEIGLGLAQYTQDYDERLPGVGPQPSYPTPAAGYASWRGRIEAYVKSKQIFQCPSATGSRKNDFHADGLPNSYMGNGGQKLSYIDAPSTTLIAFDGIGSQVYPGWNGDFNVWSSHLTFMNVLFVDGHVKAYKPIQTATPINMWTVMDDGAMDTSVGAWTNTWGLPAQQARFSN